MTLTRPARDRRPRRRGIRALAAAFYIPELTFESLTNDEERNFFNDVPTSFSLPGETVDRLIEEGRKLLRESTSSG